EDTDLQRSTQESVDAIIDNIRWLGLDWDEGPIRQSDRFRAYASHAERLVAEGKAYRSEERKGAHQAVILKRPSRRIVVTDLVHGNVEFDPEVVGDLVLMKSDGTPTYNFACVIDDTDMAITHIIRGDDHLSNTPKQLVLYEALGLAVPQFAHVPLIMGPDGSRLSKRHGATSVGQFRDQGILPGALVNFLALLGWSPGDNREMMPLKDLIAAFSLDRVSSKSAVFDTRKLTWLNAQYLKLKTPPEIAVMAVPFMREFGVDPSAVDGARMESIVRLLSDRFKTLRELAEQSYYFFSESVRYDEKAVAAQIRKPGGREILAALVARLEALPSFDMAAVEEAVRGIIAERGVKPGEIIQPARVALTGRTVSAGMFETMAALGKEVTLARLKQWIVKSE
ncbi:MAG: glutamate--tRNA ligase, partial [Candidatus Aureabacteria bacterium]|nr:glutamate--tRNA ligase [Candidatus Auribacterota bacterium]